MVSDCLGLIQEDEIDKGGGKADYLSFDLAISGYF